MQSRRITLIFGMAGLISSSSLHAAALNLQGSQTFSAELAAKLRDRNKKAGVKTIATGLSKKDSKVVAPQDDNLAQNLQSSQTLSDELASKLKDRNEKADAKTNSTRLSKRDSKVVAPQDDNLAQNRQGNQTLSKELASKLRDRKNKAEAKTISTEMSKKDSKVIACEDATLAQRSLAAVKCTNKDECASLNLADQCFDEPKNDDEVDTTDQRDDTMTSSDQEARLHTEPMVDYQDTTDEMTLMSASGTGKNVVDLEVGDSLPAPNGKDEVIDAKEGHDDSVKPLLGKRSEKVSVISPVDLTSKDASGDTPLMVLIKQLKSTVYFTKSYTEKLEELRAIEALLARGARVDSTNNAGDNGLILAVKSGRLEVVEVCIAHANLCTLHASLLPVLYRLVHLKPPYKIEKMRLNYENYCRQVLLLFEKRGLNFKESDESGMSILLRFLTTRTSSAEYSDEVITILIQMSSQETLRAVYRDALDSGAQSWLLKKLKVALGDDVVKLVEREQQISQWKNAGIIFGGVIGVSVALVVIASKITTGKWW